MLKKLTLKNFKPFGETQEAPLAPITLIYGPNSSGKSSFIQSLMVLKQTLDESENTSTSDLVTKGRFIDVGNFSSVLHRHEVDRQVEIGLSFHHSLMERMAIGRVVAPNSNFGLLLKIGAIESNSGLVTPFLSSIDYSLESSGGRIQYGLCRQMTSVPADLEDLDEDDPFGEAWEERFIFSPETDQRVLTKYLLAVITSPEFARRGSAHMRRQNTDPGIARLSEEAILQALPNYYAIRSGVLRSNREYLPYAYGPSRRDENDIERLIGSAMSDLNRFYSIALTRTFLPLSYLGPLRSYPARFYLSQGATSNSVGATGEFTIPMLFQDKASSEGTSASDPDYSGQLIYAVNSWFQKFEIPYTLNVANIGTHITGDFIVVSLKDTRTGVVVGPADVGFGIGQLLPILVDGLLRNTLSGAGRIICVEQPEIHLHPKLQAHLADFFIDTSLGTQSSVLQGRRPPMRRPVGAQWIIETHSEALMLRLQRRIREGRLSPDDVSVLYVEPFNEIGAKIQQLRLDDRGEFIDEWPSGFFEESFQEMMEGR